MERRVRFEPHQQVTSEDALKLHGFVVQSLDTIIGKLLIPDIAFEGFAVVQSGPAEVTVGSGHLFDRGRDFFNDQAGGTTIDLLARLPVVTRRIVAITVWGVDRDVQMEPRTFLVDAETRATQAKEMATETWRWANIGEVAGVEGPDPIPPAVQTDVCVVAWVTLGPTGVLSIRRNDAALAPNLRGVDNRINGIDAWRILIGTLIDTLRSDMTALAARIYGTAKYALVRQIAADVARIKDQFRLPSSYTSYAVDHFLTENDSDTEHPDWLAKIEEGCRFPPAAGFDAQLGLLNILDPLVINSTNVLLPAWDAVSRLANVGMHAEVSISQYQYQTVDMVQKTMSRQVTRYGTPFTVCSNSEFWQQGSFDYNTWTFRRGNEVFEVQDSFTDAAWDDQNAAGGIYVHNIIRLQQVWYDTVDEPYWDRVTQNYAISGAVIGQSFLNAQDGWVSQINLYFSKVAATGNVDVFLCELTNGMPDPQKILARSTRQVEDLRIATAAVQTPTQFMIQPTFLKKGRYAILVITAGNHFLWTLKNTNYVAGTFFTSTDGNWFQGDLTTDLAFELLFAKFRSNMTAVQLQPLQLQNGIAAVHINADTIIPDNCRLYYEIQVAGIWHALDNVDGGPSALFNGLPPLLPFRAVFIGTDSVQPALGVAANSRSTTWRPRNDFRHITKPRNVPATEEIQVDLLLEAWRGAPHHTLALKLLHGPDHETVHEPDAEIEEPDPRNPETAIIRHYTFVGMGEITSFRLRMDGWTDNVLTTFHVAERFDIEDPYLAEAA